MFEPRACVGTKIQVILHIRQGEGKCQGGGFVFAQVNDLFFVSNNPLPRELPSCSGAEALASVLGTSCANRARSSAEAFSSASFHRLLAFIINPLIKLLLQITHSLTSRVKASAAPPTLIHQDKPSQKQKIQILENNTKAGQQQ
ncbi:hypothetical protein THH46_04695 [Pseudomonas sp. NA13]